MPTYVYRFLDSGETIEVHQAFTDEALTEAVHPESGEVLAVKKVFTPVGVTFKGGGFYKTDSRGSGSKRSGTASSSSSEASGSSSGESSSGESSSSSGESTSPASTPATPAATASSSTD